MQALARRLDDLRGQSEALLRERGARAPSAPSWHADWLSAALQRWLTQASDLSEPARAALTAVPPLLANCLAADPQPWLQHHSGQRQVLELACASLRGWDVFSGRRSDALPQQIQQVLATLAQGGPVDAASLALGDLLRQHAAEVRPLEQQLIQKERQQRQQLDAARGVARELQQRLAAHSVPEFALPFLSTELRKLLHVTRLQYGDASTQWAELLAQLDTLVWALTETDLAVLRNGYSSRVLPCQAALQQQFASLHHQSEIVSGFFDSLDFYLLSRLNGQNPVMPVQPWPAETEVAAGWTQTGDAALKARALRVGDWVELTLPSGPVRARVIDKDLQQGLYLLANLSGLRVARLSTAELTAQFDQQLIRIIDSRPVLVAALPLLIEELENRLLQLRLDSQQLAEQQRQQEAARLQQELALQRAEQAAAQARAEAEREAQARAEAEARLLAECEQACKRLQAGAWIELRGGDGDGVAQLAVILNRSGELLFVDRQGRKLLQVTPAQLAEQVMQGRARILDYGRALDDALQQMVAEQRQKKDQWLG